MQEMRSLTRRRLTLIAPSSNGKKRGSEPFNLRSNRSGASSFGNIGVPTY